MKYHVTLVDRYAGVDAVFDAIREYGMRPNVSPLEVVKVEPSAFGEGNLHIYCVEGRDNAHRLHSIACEKHLFPLIRAI